MAEASETKKSVNKFAGIEIAPDLTKGNFFFLFLNTLIIGIMMTIPAKAKNVEGAYKWINFMLRPENAAIFTNAEKYGTASAGAVQLLDASVKANFERCFPLRAIANIKWYPPVPAKLEEIEGRILDKVKAAK